MYEDHATTDWLRYLAIGLACLFLLAMAGSISTGTASAEVPYDPAGTAIERPAAPRPSPESPETDPATLPAASARPW